jgi:transcriptional regulator with XRE-family HTH domain
MRITETEQSLLADLRGWATDGTARRIREETGRTIYELAAELGVSQPVAWYWESGQHLIRPRHPAVYAYARWLRKHGAGRG